MIIDLVGVDVDPAKIICQTIVPTPGGCGPATFLNALRFGPPAFQDAFADLPGESDKEKLAGVIATHGSAPSALVPGQRLFGSRGGVWADDAHKYFKSILGDRAERLLCTYFELMGQETPAEHLRRIHGLLVLSLERGVPIITSIRAFAARKRQDQEIAWERIAGHYILIVRVPREVSVGAQGFMFEFVEPAYGKLCEGYIYSETVRAFKALKEACAGYMYNETTKEFEPMKGSLQRSEWIENGFLHVVSPSLFLETSMQPWYARTFVTLDFGLGKFGSERTPSNDEPDRDAPVWNPHLG